MINVQIDENTLLDLLVERVKYWTDDDDTIELFTDYYQNMIDGGCFEGSEFDPMIIVDNDYVNYFRVMEEDDPEYTWAMENDDRIYGKLDNGTILVYMA